MMLERLKERAKRLRKEIMTIYFAYQHPDLPLLPKIIILATLGYAMSPIDLIPDFIPVLGYLDDLVIIPALISLSIKLIPEKIIVEARARAENERFELKKKPVFAVIFILIWVIIAVSILMAIIHFIKGRR